MTVNHDVTGSSPVGGVKRSLYLWSVGQGVKTPPFHGGNTGSNPVRTILYSAIAQSVERMTVNHDVTGSSPVGGATKKASLN